MGLYYTIKHGDATWTSSSPVDYVSLLNGSSTASIATTSTRTLNCGGKYMNNDLVIGAKTLHCTGKIMENNVTVTTYNPNPICFTATRANSTIELIKEGSPPIANTAYSRNGTTWTTFTPSATSGTNVITLTNVGDKVYFRNDITADVTRYNWIKFDMSGGISASGNINSLYSSNNFANLSILTYKYCYAHLFEYCFSLESAADLQLPAEILSEACYYGLFESCGITSAPKLPATTLAKECYQSMFSDCTSLVTAPNLPATTLADGCYGGMFYYCCSLVTPPSLFAVTLTNNCYNSMFYSCTSLTQAPELPATTLAEYCYFKMFSGCTSLKVAPKLPAETLATSCYREMFYDCKSLTTAPELKVTTLESSCYQSMFLNCTKLTSAPALPATTLANNCYSSMFRGCTSLTTAPELPATTLANNCYSSMFYGCILLTTPPVLPATTLADDCYIEMFGACSALVKVPLLKAITLADSCYSFMFKNCTSLQVWTSSGSGHDKAWTVPTTGTFTNTNIQYSMFSGCPGTRSTGDDFPGAEGASYTFYTQNAPV